MYLNIFGRLGRCVPFLMALSVCTVFMLFLTDRCTVSAAAVSEVYAASNDTTAVNLKEKNWIYSTHLDKDNHAYAAITGYNGNALSLDIPSSLGGYEVRSVSREAFVGDKYLTSVTVSEGITDIGKYCFQGCVGLRSVSLPTTLKSIGDGAFYGCSSLTDLDIPDNVTRIGDYAFYNCTHVKSVTLSKALKSIGDAAFGRCSMLETVDFGKSLESVGSDAFHGCTSLKAVQFPPEVISLGSRAFVNCKSITKAELGENLEEIRSETFRGCESLKSVSFGGSVREIGSSAFEGCVSLNSVALGDGVNTIGLLAFHNCSGLQDIYLGCVGSIGMGAFNGCTSLKQVLVSAGNSSFKSQDGILYDKSGEKLILCPQGATGGAEIAQGTVEIGDYAFNGCEKLTGVSFPDSVTKIGMASFLSCRDIMTISLPSSMEKVGCLSLGYYFENGETKKASYISLYGEAGSSVELYSAAHEVGFRPYRDTFLLSTERAVIEKGKTFQVEYAFISDRKADTVWESSDTSVVEVNNGVLKAVSEGEADITVTADGLGSKVIKVIVIRQSENVSDVRKSQDARHMYRGEYEELSSILEQIIDPFLSVDKFWYSSDPSVATVGDDGQVTAIGKGSANVVCRMPDGSENYFLITVAEKALDFSIFPPEEQIAVAQSVQLHKDILPSTSDDEITWKSHNTDVATVDSTGVVTAVSQGNCDITATTASGLKSTITVECVIPAEDISLDLEERSVYQGKEFNLNAQLSPSDSKQRIVWSSSDPSVVSVNSKGKVTGTSFGTAEVYAKTASGVVASCTVNVVAEAEKLNLDVKNLTLNCGTEQKLNAVIFPSYSPETTDKCTWNSTDEKVASVDENGVVRAVGVGNCIINCKTSGDLISKCRVQVTQPAHAAQITSDLDKIYIGEVIQLKLKLFPNNTTDDVEWSCSDEKIARVTSQGSVKGRAAGKVVITAKATNEVSGQSVTAAYEIEVLKKADNVKLNRNSISMNVGSTDSLLYVITPSDSNDTVEWTSSDESVASVRSDGLITAVKSGTCYIYIKTGSGCSARCKIVVN